MAPDGPERIAELQQMLAARIGKPGYTKNVIALRAEIARLQGLENARGQQPAE